MVTLAVLCLNLSGCGGCRKPPTAAQKKADEEKQKKQDEPVLPPLTMARIQMQPHDQAALQQNSVKPGHWVATVQALRANQRDMQIEVESFTVDGDSHPLELDHLPHQMTVARPGALPKGQARVIESWDKIPRLPPGKAVRLERRIQARSGGREEARAQEPTTLMPDYQYYMVVLAETPSRYTFTQQRLYALAQPPNELSSVPPARLYRVVIPQRGRIDAGLPTHPLTWTSISVLVWDGIHPGELRPSQQQALLDWLHWGGQLIISGPGSLEKLAGSFLEPYLPASRKRAAELKSADFGPLDESWSLTHKPTGQRQSVPVLDSSPVAGVELDLRPEGSLVEGCGALVAERAVGAGRIALTAFPLTHRTLLNWPCYDGFFNGALLRHPARRFTTDDLGGVEFVWDDRPALTLDPRYISNMRYLSRDAGREDENSREPLSAAEDRRLAGCMREELSGVGGWNDFSPVSNAARDTLREAAGISIPDASFVLRIVAIYLLVLTPLNWGFFRLIGRVEWAWAAAPVIAIVASVAVVRLAQLDIGFARSQTEVATLEIQAGYSRAHLTRYTALYTSLSTNYQLEFDDESALAQPMASDPRYRRPTHDALVPVRLERDRTVRLSGFSVISNSTGLVHSEQMFDLAGAFQVDGDEAAGFVLRNGTRVPVRDAAVFRRRSDGPLEVAFLGDLAPQTNVPLKFQSAPADGPLIREWTTSPQMSGAGVERGEVSLRRLVDIAADQLPLGSGEMRLVGWAQENWQGQKVRPAANQMRVQTLVLVHLTRGAWPAPQPDVNLLSDFTSDPARPLTDDDFEQLPDAQPIETE